MVTEEACGKGRAEVTAVARPFFALLARFGENGPEFKLCSFDLIEFWQLRGWILLADEREINVKDR